MKKLKESPSAMFKRTLHVDTDLAGALERGGLGSLEEIAYFPSWELARIAALDQTQTLRLRETARLYLLNEAIANEDDQDLLEDLLDDDPTTEY